MPSRKKRASRRNRGSGFLPALIIILALIAVAMAALLIRTNPLASDDNTQDLPVAYPVEPNFVEQAKVTAAPLVLTVGTPQATMTPTPAPATPEPTAGPDMETGDITPRQATIKRLSPTAVPGDYFLPVYNKANRSPDDALMIALTLDKCDVAKVMAEYVTVAYKYDAQLTLFPTGDALTNKKMTKNFRSCVTELGFQIENFTYNKKADYMLSDGELALQMWRQNITLSYIIGKDYKQNFYRPTSLYAACDQRTHYMMGQMGFKGIGGYTYNYDGQTLDSLMETLENGNIYRFDMSQKSLKLFKKFIDAASRKGYRCVTMNELFGFNTNVISDKLTLDKQILPTFEGYVPTYYDLELNDRSVAVINLQNRLAALDYLRGPTKNEPYVADGIYGGDTSVAISEFQAKVGLPATGDADVATQLALFAKDAPMR